MSPTLLALLGLAIGGAFFLNRLRRDAIQARRLQRRRRRAIAARRRLAATPTSPQPLRPGLRCASRGPAAPVLPVLPSRRAHP